MARRNHIFFLLELELGNGHTQLLHFERVFDPSSCILVLCFAFTSLLLGRRARRIVVRCGARIARVESVVASKIFSPPINTEIRHTYRSFALAGNVVHEMTLLLQSQ
jgi:hypothetical protein